MIDLSSGTCLHETSQDQLAPSRLVCGSLLALPLHHHFVLFHRRRLHVLQIFSVLPCVCLHRRERERVAFRPVWTITTARALDHVTCAVFCPVAPAQCIARRSSGAPHGETPHGKFNSFWRQWRPPRPSASVRHHISSNAERAACRQTKRAAAGSARVKTLASRRRRGGNQRRMSRNAQTLEGEIAHRRALTTATAAAPTTTWSLERRRRQCFGTETRPGIQHRTPGRRLPLSPPCRTSIFANTRTI